MSKHIVYKHKNLDSIINSQIFYTQVKAKSYAVNYQSDLLSV